MTPKALLSLGKLTLCSPSYDWRPTRISHLLRRAGDGEGVPLEGGDGRDVDEDVVARLEGEVRRTPDDQRHDPGGEDDAGGDPALAVLKEVNVFYA